MVKKVVTKRITRKVISKPAVVEEVSQEIEQVASTRTKKVCTFCQTKQAPSYIDVASLRRFLTDRGRILPKLRTNLCSKHQRKITKQIKYARHLALLPFTPKV